MLVFVECQDGGKIGLNGSSWGLQLALLLPGWPSATSVELARGAAKDLGLQLAKWLASTEFAPDYRWSSSLASGSRLTCTWKKDEDDQLFLDLGLLQQGVDAGTVRLDFAETELLVRTIAEILNER